MLPEKKKSNSWNQSAGRSIERGCLCFSKHSRIHHVEKKDVLPRQPVPLGVGNPKAYQRMNLPCGLSDNLGHDRQYTARLREPLRVLCQGSWALFSTLS